MKTEITPALENINKGTIAAVLENLEICFSI
jgi:hypothetical protein